MNYMDLCFQYQHSISCPDVALAFSVEALADVVSFQNVPMCIQSRLIFEILQGELRDNPPFWLRCFGKQGFAMHHEMQ